jgi:hypothetical protein
MSTMRGFSRPDEPVAPSPEDPSPLSIGGLVLAVLIQAGHVPAQKLRAPLWGSSSLSAARSAREVRLRVRAHHSRPERGSRPLANSTSPRRRVATEEEVHGVC